MKKTFTIPIAQATAILNSLSRLQTTFVPASFLIARNLMALGSNPDIASAEKLRNDLVVSYADKDDQGRPKQDAEGRVHVPPQSMAQFNEDFEQIAARQVTVELDLLPLTYQQHISGGTPQDMLVLMPLWDLPENAPPAAKPESRKKTAKSR